MTNEEIYEKLREAKLLLDEAVWYTNAPTDDGFEIPNESVRLDITRTIQAVMYKIDDVMSQISSGPSE